MTESSSAVRATSTPSPYRLAIGVLRIAAGLAVFAAITTQITDK
eukprot:gene48131-58958_t